MNVAALVLATAGAGLGGALAARLLRLSDPLDRVIAAILLACTQALLTSLVVGGVLDHFDRWWLVGATALGDAALLSVFALRARAPLEPNTRVRSASVGALRALAPWQRLLLAAALAATLWRAFLAVLLPPYAYDALSYHLTAVASWVQRGSIGTNPYAFCCGRYPSNAEVLFAWPTVLLGRDTFTDAVQIVFAVLGSLAVIGIARAAGLTKAGSITAGALFALTPIVLAQSNTDYNDVAITGLFLTGLYFSARFLTARGFAFSRGAHDAALSHALLAGIAAGLALGMKTNGSVLAAAVAVPMLAQLALAVRRGRLPKRFAGAASGALLGAILLTGGWWYARNWIQVGNPVAPFEVRALGLELFKGPASLHEYLTVSPGGPRNPVSEILRSWWSDVSFWTRSDLSYEERSGGLGPLWSWLGWPALGLASVAALRRRPDLVVSVLLPAAAAFAVLPYRWWSRFTMYLAGLGVIAVVALLERVPADWRRRSLATVIVLLSLAGAALATRRVDPSGYGRRLGTGDLISLAAHPDRQRTVGNLFFREFAWVDHVSPHATIGVEFQAPQIRFLYPLFGARLERHVVLLNPGDESSIDKRLGGGEPAYLFVGSGSAFDRWAHAHPRRYRLLGQDRGTRVFRRVTR